MKITSIKQQVKNPERVSVFVDDKYSFSLSLNELLAQKIKKDDELDQADVKRFKKISADGKIKARALEWVLGRPRSLREFGDYLYRKQAEPELIGKLGEEFQKKSYLDDAKFALWLIEMRQRGGRSNRAIRAELYKKGVGREVVEETMAGDDNEMQRLKELIAKKQKLPRYQKDPEKLKQYLVRQGFSWQDVKQQLDLNR